MDACDALVIGGGFYGLYLAEFLAHRGNRVILCERDAGLMRRASYVNQARVHNGYHYPRSILTAVRSRVNYPRFVEEFRPAIDDSFDQVYAVARRFSKVTADQFYQSMRRIGAEIHPAPKRIAGLFDSDYIEAVFVVRECAFNGDVLRNLMAERVRKAGVEVRLNTTVRSVTSSDLLPSSSGPLPPSSGPLPPSSGPLPPCGGGLGWGVGAASDSASTPHPNPPPQGGRGQEGPPPQGRRGPEGPPPQGGRGPGEGGREPEAIRVVTDATCIDARQVFCCAYSHTNAIAAASGLPLIPLKHELAELALIEVPPALHDMGATVMDGPFFSIMPFPARGLHTLSHVRYTPHGNWQDGNGPYRLPDELFRATAKESAFPYMIRDAARYLPALAECRYRDSLWEIKTVLPRSEIDDSRPILFRRDAGLPGYHVVMGAKIDNVYDIVDVISQNTVQKSL